MTRLCELYWFEVHTHKWSCSFCFPKILFPHGFHCSLLLPCHLAAYLDFCTSLYSVTSHLRVAAVLTRRVVHHVHLD